MNRQLATTVRTLTSKRGSWFVLGGVVVLIALLFGLLSGAGEDRANETAPTDSESTQVQQTLDKFPNADEQSVIVVASKDDDSAISSDEQKELGTLGTTLSDYADQQKSDSGDSDAKSSGDAGSGSSGARPIMSDDGRAALLMAPIEVGLNNADTADTVDGLRDFIADDSQAGQLEDSGMSLLVTGGPAIGADIASAFNGADFTLLIVTIVIVALLLELGGELVIESNPGSGFAISATLPSQSQLHTRGEGLSTPADGAAADTTGHLGEGGNRRHMNTDAGENA
ncbi:MMPL family transporter [Brevibacterium oceani]|uniref:MMPL family transporter n=1 Tax=Brevibacterium oceani TaxID=358099 RepID=UPI0015E69236|nr:MMPL family transporter [Brevibacterium oceani]